MIAPRVGGRSSCPGCYADRRSRAEGRANTDNDARLRDTLRVYLGCKSSYKLAADELTLDSNTVKYRVGRAMIRRGRPITNGRFDVELALLLCHWYGDALLSPKPS